MTLRFHLTLIRMAKIKSQVTADVGEDVKRIHSLLVELQPGITLRKSVWQILRKLKIVLLEDSAIPLVNIYTKQMFHHITRTHAPLC